MISVTVVIIKLYVYIPGWGKHRFFILSHNVHVSEFFFFLHNVADSNYYFFYNIETVLNVSAKN